MCDYLQVGKLMIFFSCDSFAERLQKKNNSFVMLLKNVFDILTLTEPNFVGKYLQSTTHAFGSTKCFIVSLGAKKTIAVVKAYLFL